MFLDLSTKYYIEEKLHLMEILAILTEQNIPIIH